MTSTNVKKPPPLLTRSVFLTLCVCCLWHAIPLFRTYQRWWYDKQNMTEWRWLSSVSFSHSFIHSFAIGGSSIMLGNPVSLIPFQRWIEEEKSVQNPSDIRLVPFFLFCGVLRGRPAWWEFFSAPDILCGFLCCEIPNCFTLFTRRESLAQSAHLTLISLKGDYHQLMIKECKERLKGGGNATRKISQLKFASPK